MKNETIEKAMILAAEKGKESGTNAAAWISQDSWGGRIACGRRARENAAAFLRKLEDGDLIEVSPPDLSGTWADGETSASLRDWIAWKLRMEPEELEELENEICSAWEESAFSSFWEELETSARSVAFPNS